MHDLITKNANWHGAIHRIPMHEARIALLWPIAGSIFFLLFNWYYLGGPSVPLVFADEFGYLGNAAFLAGHDWSAVGTGFAYYGFGYSLLIAPAYWITSDPGTIYSFALFINDLCLAGAFLLAYDSALRLIGKNSRLEAFLAALAACAYPAFQFYAAFAWAEALLTLLVWLMFYIYLRLDRQRIKLWHLLVLSFIAVYAYAVHPRALVLVIAMLLMVGLMKYKARIRWLDVLAVIVVTIGLMIAVTAVKNYLVINFRHGSTGGSGNVVHAAGAHLIGLLSLAWVKQFLRTVGGQSFYLATSTFGLWLVGMCVALYYWCRDWVVRGVPRSHEETNTQMLQQVEAHFLALGFVLLSTVGMLVVSSVFMMHSGRVDGVFYGRYTEAFIGPVLLLALCVWCRSRRKWMVPAGMLVAWLAALPLGRLAWRYVEYQGLTAINWINIPGWLPFRTAGWRIDFWLLACAVIYVTLILALIGSVSRRLAIAATAMAFLVFSVWNIEQMILPGKQRWYDGMAFARRQNGLSSKRKLYFYLPKAISGASEYGLTRWALQLQLPDTKIVPIEQLGGFARNNWYEIAPQTLLDSGLPDNTKVIGWGKHGEMLVTSRQNRSALITETFKGDSLHTQVGKVDRSAGMIKSRHKQGFLTYGPYIFLPAGHYDVKWYGTLLHSSVNAPKGHVDVSTDNGKNIVAHAPLRSTKSSAGRNVLREIQFSLTSPAKKVEFRVYVHADVEATVRSIELQQLEH